MTKYDELIGLKFNKLTILNANFNKKKRQTYCYCLCECGNYKLIRGYSVISGTTKSCGKCPLNDYDLSNGVGAGYTKKGEKFIFDVECYDMIKPYSWRLQNGYVVTSVGAKTLFMHRLILNAPEGKLADHINRIKTDNRKSNLRIVGHKINNLNVPLRPTNKSGKAGVSYSDKRHKWIVNIKDNNKTVYGGAYESLDDAIKKRKELEITYYGFNTPF